MAKTTQYTTNTVKAFATQSATSFATNDKHLHLEHSELIHAIF